MQRTLVLGLAFVLGLAAVSAAGAQSAADDYPQRNVTFLCPFPAGGGTDILTRILAAELQDKLKRTVIVENRPGAGTIIAAQAVARAAPDGHTIFLAPVTTLALGPNIYKTLPYDTVKDFAPIGLVGSSQFGLVANPKLGAATLAELIALIKSRDGLMSYASSGASTPHHLFMEMFLKMIGAKAQHVPYRGSVPALTDVIAGQIPIHDRRSRSRYPRDQRGQGEDLRRDVDGADQGDARCSHHRGGGRAGLWRHAVVLGGGAGGHAAADHRQAQPGAHDLLSRPETQDKMNALAISPWTSTPDELAQFVPAEIKKWAQVVKDAGITPE